MISVPVCAMPWHHELTTSVIMLIRKELEKVNLKVMYSSQVKAKCCITMTQSVRKEGVITGTGKTVRKLANLGYLTHHESGRPTQNSKGPNLGTVLHDASSS